MNDINTLTEQSYLQRAQSMEERIWIDTNTSKIDEILRVNYDKNVTEFTEIVLTSVADLVDAVRGAFFVTNQLENLLYATAGYACVVNNFLKKTFDIGDDLIGFCAKSKKIRFIENLPAQNVTIESGLAKVSAQAMIITPLIFNDVVYGVIELNFLQKPDSKTVALIERLSRNIASTLQSIQNNEQTKILLAELQEKTNAMEATEEELRQNMEELSAIRDDLENKQHQVEEANRHLTRNQHELQQALKLAHEKEKLILEKEQSLQKLEEKLKHLTGDGSDIDVRFTDLFDVEQVQAIQDAFAKAVGVASIITELDGTPITKPSNFSYLCEKVIRCTPKGLHNCMKSDAELGTKVKGGAAVQPCLSGGLTDGGTGIFIGEKQIANWLIGQVLSEDTDDTKFLEYATAIEADVEEFKKGLKTVTRMSSERFKAIADFLYVFAQQFSQYALQNYIQAKQIAKSLSNE